MNYRTLIIGGYGTIGSSLLRVGGYELGLFESIVAIDIDFTNRPINFADAQVSFLTGDIEDPGFLTELCRNVMTPALLFQFGSVTAKVVKNSTVPVVTIPVVPDKG